MKARVYNLTHQMIADPRRQLPEEGDTRGIVHGTSVRGERIDEIELDYYARKELLAAVKLLAWYKYNLIPRLEDDCIGATDITNVLYPIQYMGGNR